jgi:hypothetical protein
MAKRKMTLHFTVSTIAAMIYAKGLPETVVVTEYLVKIGRDEGAHIRLAEPTADRMQAVIEVGASPGDLMLIDIGVSGRVLLNGVCVSKAKIKVGDEIRIGETIIVLTGAVDAAAKPSTRNATVYESTHYQVVSNSDTCEGRGERVVIGRSSSLALANQCAKSRGVFGADADVHQATERMVEWDGKLYLLGEEVQMLVEDVGAARARALAKLTEEDLAALGLAGTVRR